MQSPVRWRGPQALALIAFLAAPHAGAVSLGQIDTFQSGTSEGWTVGLGTGSVHPAPPTAVATGGPAGAGDGYLLLQAFGGGATPGNRLTAINPVQWSGDYAAAGITAIRMNVINLGATDLSLRLYFEDPVVGPPTNEAITAARLVPVGSGWIAIEFPVTADALTALAGSVDAVLADTTLLRLFHSFAEDFPGESVVATLGIDNVQAVPEPGAMLLVGTGLASLAARARQLRRRPATR